MSDKKLQQQNLPIITQENGAIFIENERMLLTSSSVFGTLRKELIENIGMERVKGFLLRYGWNLGANDAKKALAKQFTSVQETLRQGPILHMVKGYTKVNTKQLDVTMNKDKKVEAVQVEGEWIYSYEADEHLRQFGLSDYPACHTLIGYASGYYSTICGHTVAFKEISCRAQGEKVCNYIGKSVHLWEDGAVNELKYYEDATIVKELERTYETLLQERNNLTRVSEINKKLTEALINGSDLQSIAYIVHSITNTPLLIEDNHYNVLACSGLTEAEAESVQASFSQWLQEGHFLGAATRIMKADNHYRLLTPIMLQQKALGYCSFIYPEGIERFPELDYLLLERIATVVSLYLLNEKTRFEAMERMKGQFLEQILSDHFSTKKEILNRGKYININLELPYYIAIIKYQYSGKHLKNELQFHEELIESTHQFFQNKQVKIIIGQRAGNIILYIQAALDIVALCEQYIATMSNQYGGANLQLGISSQSEDILIAKEYYDEAQSALKMTTLENKVVSFDSLGMVGMLVFTTDEAVIVQHAKRMLMPLLKYKEPANIELVKTLYIFLKNGGNLERTMEELSISKSGLRYRIQKIEHVLNQNLRDPKISHQLLLTLQVLILKGELTLDS